MEFKKIKVDWTEYLELCNKLALKIQSESKYTITDIIAVARGGFIPSQCIAYHLNIKRIHSIGISSYSDDNKKQKKSIIYQKITTKFEPEHNILIVDDIADTGRTLFDIIHPEVVGHAGKMLIATIHKKQRSIIYPDYYVKMVDDNDWIVYPYDMKDV